MIFRHKWRNIMNDRQFLSMKPPAFSSLLANPCRGIGFSFLQSFWVFELKGRVKIFNTVLAWNADGALFAYCMDKMLRTNDRVVLFLHDAQKPWGIAALPQNTYLTASAERIGGRW
jgi:hypothetical protein